MSIGNARIANPSSLIQFDVAPLGGSGGCTSANNDWVKDYWVTTDIGPLN